MGMEANLTSDDYYDNLGIARDAAPDEIKRAYVSLSSGMLCIVSFTLVGQISQVGHQVPSGQEPR